MGKEAVTSVLGYPGAQRAYIPRAPPRAIGDAPQNSPTSCHVLKEAGARANRVMWPVKAPLTMRWLDRQAEVGTQALGLATQRGVGTQAGSSGIEGLPTLANFMRASLAIGECYLHMRPHSMRVCMVHIA